jgi:hypothetical protein
MLWTRSHNIDDFEEATRAARACRITYDRVGGCLQGTRSLGDVIAKAFVPKVT